MQNFKVGLDFDGVLVDTASKFVDLYNKITGENIRTCQLSEYETDRCLPDKYSYIAKEIWNIPALYDYIQPIENSQKYTKILSMQVNIELFVVTTSHPNVIKTKYDVIAKLFPWINQENIIVTSHKELIDLDILVDDYPKNLKGFHGNKFLMDASWNKMFDEKSIGAVRAKSWYKIFDYIMSICND